MEIQPVLLEEPSLTTEKPLQVALLPISVFEITNAGNILRNAYRVISCSDKIVHWHLGGRSPVSNFWELSSNLEKNHIHMQDLEFSANQVSAESNETWCSSSGNFWKLRTCPLPSWWNAAGVFGKFFLIRRGIIHVQNFGILSLSNCRRKDGKRRYGY